MLENRHACMNLVSLFLLEKEQLVEGFQRGHWHLCSSFSPGWVMDNRRWKAGRKETVGMSPLERRMCRVVSWGPGEGTGEKGPGMNTKTSSRNGIEVRVRGEGHVEFDVQLSLSASIHSLNNFVFLMSTYYMLETM